MMRRSVTLGVVLALCLVLVALAAAARRETSPVPRQMLEVGKTYVFALGVSDVTAEVLDRPQDDWVHAKVVEIDCPGCAGAKGQEPGDTWINLRQVLVISTADPNRKAKDPPRAPCCAAPSL